MGITVLKGDVFSTEAQALMLGMNTRGQAEVNPMETVLRDKYPVFYSEHRRLGKSGSWETGQLWIFRDATPWLLGAMIRETGNGITRTRFIDQVLLRLLRDYQRERIESLAIAPLAPDPEWAVVQQIIKDTLHSLPIPIFLYEQHVSP